MYDDNLDDSDFGDFGAFEAGTGYALFRHGQDRQTQQLIRAMQSAGGAGDVNVDVHVHTSEEEGPSEPINATDFTTITTPTEWDGFIGQEPMKRQLKVYVQSAKIRNDRLPHTLFASGFPGVGKTSMARLLAKQMGVQIWELVPPFKLDALVEAAQRLNDHDILFIDEVHKLADAGKRGAEFLLKMLEDGVIFLPSGEVIHLPNITVIGATTDADKLPEPVIDRFKITPYFQAYSWAELSEIAVHFAFVHQADQYVDDEMAVTIAGACRNTPRIIEGMITTCRDMAVATGATPSPLELLEFLEVEEDGLTRVHIHYITAMRQYFPRVTDDVVEYIVGEAAIQQILRQTKPGIQRIEAFLVERGLVDRTPRGRRLTDVGIERAEEFIAQGKGAADVA